MAVDHGFEGRLRRELHASLDSAVGPHPWWTDSPAAWRIRDEGDAGAAAAARRLPRSTLLIAAAVTAVALTGVLVVGGSLRPLSATPPPSVMPAVVASVASPSASPSAEVAVAEPSTPSARPASEEPCLTTWTHHGTYPAGGLQDGSFLWRLEGDGGQLHMEFLNSIDTVKEISIVPVDPPLRDSAGRAVHADGTAFFKLVIDGLTRATEITRDDMKPNDVLNGPGSTIVGHPIAEVRRLYKPKQVVGTPTQHEIWLIGVDFPACLSVRTSPTGLYEVPQPGDNVVTVSFSPIARP